MQSNVASLVTDDCGKLASSRDCCLLRRMSQQNHLQLYKHQAKPVRHDYRVETVFKNNYTPIYFSETSDICCWFERSEQENLRAVKITKNLEEGSVPKRFAWLVPKRFQLVGAEKLEATLVLARSRQLWCWHTWGGLASCRR